MKRLKWGLSSLALVVGIFSLGFYIFGHSSLFDGKDIEDIKRVLAKSETIAEEAYIDAKKHYNSNTLEENKKNIIEFHKKKFREVFAKEPEDQMERVWIDRQVENAKTGPNTVDCGISDVAIKSIFIKNDIANVSAISTKYLIDLVNKDGKGYLDKMEGEVFMKAVLVKKDGKWKISQMDVNPEYGTTTHTLTEEK